MLFKNPLYYTMGQKTAAHKHVNVARGAYIQFKFLFGNLV